MRANYINLADYDHKDFSRHETIVKACISRNYLPDLKYYCTEHGENLNGNCKNYQKYINVTMRCFMLICFIMISVCVECIRYSLKKIKIKSQNISWSSKL